MHSEEAPDSLAKAERLLRISALLREGPRNVRDLIRQLSPTLATDGRGWAATRRAIQRDLDDLERLDPEFRKKGGRVPTYWIETHRTTLHPVEVLALHAAARLTYHRASGQRSHHLSALQKLNAWLPEHLQAVARRSVVDLGRRPGREDLNLEKVASAWLGGHPLRFEYQKPGGSGQWRTNVLEIYLVEAHPQNLDLYVIGRETSFHQDVRTFKLSRLRQLQVVTDATYTIPDTFDPLAFFQSAWGVVGAQGNATQPIALRFRADAAYRVLEGGYAHLKVGRRQDDGSVIATLDAPLDSSGLPREVLPWVYSFGPRVEVLSPPQLREHWLGELREAARQGGGE